MKKSHIATLLIFLIAIPATLILGMQLPGKWYFLTSTLVIGEILIPFFLAFEGRKPQARELVIMAVMCALAVAARVAIVIPNFKAIYGIICRENHRNGKGKNDFAGFSLCLFSYQTENIACCNDRNH